MKLSFPVDSGHYISDSTPLANSVCTNLYPSTPFVQGGSSRGGLFAFPGLSEYWSHGVNNITGTHGFNFNGTTLVVLEGFNSQDSILYSVSGGTGTLLGSFGQSRGAPSYASNGQTACFVFPESNKSFFYDTTSGLVQITDSVFQGYEAQDGGVRSVDETDGFFVFNTYETFFKGSLVTTNGGKDFDALDFVKPFLKEKAICTKTIKGEVYVFGENTTKVYSNIGGADFPFQEIPGATMQKGTISHRTVVEFDNSFYFIGSGYNETNAVWRGIGGGAVAKVSTDYIDKNINTEGADDFNVFAYMQNGRAFVAATSRSVVYISAGPFNIPVVIGNGGVYDVQTSAVNGVPVWVDVDVLFYDSAFEVGGNLYFTKYNGVLSIDTNTSIGAVAFTGQYLQAQSDPMIINRLELIMEAGVGAEMAGDQAALNPSVLLEFSDDGAKTWNSAGSQSVGRFGQYKNRLVWPMLGLAPQSRIFRFTADTKVPLRFHRIDMEVEKGFLYG